jgi:hypothetical protein
MHLTVIHPFEKYNRGDKITEPEKIREILEGTDGVPHDNVRHVVRTADAGDNQTAH